MERWRETWLDQDRGKRKHYRLKSAIEKEPIGGGSMDVFGIVPRRLAVSVFGVEVGVGI